MRPELHKGLQNRPQEVVEAGVWILSVSWAFAMASGVWKNATHVPLAVLPSVAVHIVVQIGPVQTFVEFLGSKVWHRSGRSDRVRPQYYTSENRPN
jgi:hypothetical protein